MQFNAPIGMNIWNIQYANVMRYEIRYAMMRCLTHIMMYRVA
jgi:hypothetical protein